MLILIFILRGVRSPQVPKLWSPVGASYLHEGHIYFERSMGER
jgi:hypothetical protein